MAKFGSLQSGGMTWCFMSLTLAPQKLCTLTTRPFLLNSSSMRPFKMRPPIKAVVPSRYFPSIFPLFLLLLAHYFCCHSFWIRRIFLFFLITSSSWCCIDFLNITYVFFFLAIRISSLVSAISSLLLQTCYIAT